MSAIGRPVRASGYDAFLSYSTALDGRLAPMVQQAVERFATPWYRFRSLRIFRDDSNLAANPGLWSAIEAALERSDWFVLLASTHAARSPWVDREVRWWLKHRSADRLLIALTDGDLRWEAGDFAVSDTDPLPPALRGALREEPRWVDLRWDRNAGTLSRSDRVFRDAVGNLAATLRGADKDVLVNENLRMHRVKMRTAAGGGSALVLVVAIAVVMTMVAVGRGRTAASEQRVATAGRVAAEAVADLDAHLDLARLLAVAAYRMSPNDQTRSALLRSVTAGPALVRFLQTGASVTAVGGTADGSAVIAGTTDGHLLRLRLDGTVERVAVGPGAVTAVAVDTHGDTVVASDRDRVFVWHPGRPPVSSPVPQALGGLSRPSQLKGLAVSPSGRTVVAIASTGPSVVVIDGATGRLLRHTPLAATWAAVGLPDDDTIMLDDDTGLWSTMSVATLADTGHGGQTQAPGDSYGCCAFSTDARYFAWSKSGGVQVVAQTARPTGAFADTGFATAQIPIDEPDTYAVSTDGSAMAMSGGGALYVASVPGTTARRLDGVGQVSALSFLGGSREVVAGAGDAVAVWNLDQMSALTAGLPVDAPSSPNAGAPPRVAVSADGRHLAVAGIGNDPVVVDDLTMSRPAITSVDQPVSDALPLWTEDDRTLLLLGDDGDGGGAAVWSGGSFRAPWSQLSTRGLALSDAVGFDDVVAARVSPDGARVVLVDEHGDIQVRDAASGTVLRTVTGVAQPLDYPWAALQNRAAISQDTTTAAFVRPGGMVRVVDVDTGQHRDLPGSPAVAVAFAGDTLLVQRGSGNLEEWNPAGGGPLRTLPGDATYSQALAVLSKPGMVARLTEHGDIELWAIASGQFLGSLAAPGPTMSTGEPPWDSTSLTATPDGTELVSATGSGLVLRWHVDPGGWASVACASVGRDLTAEQWRRYVGTTEPPTSTCPA